MSDSDFGLMIAFCIGMAMGHFLGIFYAENKRHKK